MAKPSSTPSVEIDEDIVQVKGWLRTFLKEPQPIKATEDAMVRLIGHRPRNEEEQYLVDILKLFTSCLLEMKRGDPNRAQTVVIPKLYMKLTEYRVKFMPSDGPETN